MIGLHEDLARDCTLPTEAAVVYLDENWIHLGSLGAPPPLPSSRQKKLLQTITSAAPVFSRRESDWKEMRLSAFDTAFSSTSERALTVSVREREKDRAKGSDIASAKSAQSQDIDEVAIRAAFLNFFASILKGYKHNIIYSAIGDPDAVTKFNAEKFLAGTCMFMICIDECVSVC